MKEINLLSRSKSCTTAPCSDAYDCSPLRLVGLCCLLLIWWSSVGVCTCRTTILHVLLRRRRWQQRASRWWWNPISTFVQAGEVHSLVYSCTTHVNLSTFTELLKYVGLAVSRRWPTKFYSVRESSGIPVNKRWSWLFPRLTKTTELTVCSQ